MQHGKTVMAAVDALGAGCYEAGFAAGEAHAAEEARKAAKIAPEVALPVDVLRDVYERLMFYRTYFADATAKQGEQNRGYDYLSDITRTLGSVVDALP